MTCRWQATPRRDILYPSRDARLLYVANRGSNYVHGKPKVKGRVSVIDFANGKLLKTRWRQPGHERRQRQRPPPVAVGPLR